MINHLSSWFGHDCQLNMPEVEEKLQEKLSFDVYLTTIWNYMRNKLIFSFKRIFLAQRDKQLESSNPNEHYYFVDKKY